MLEEGWRERRDGERGGREREEGGREGRGGMEREGRMGEL